jgi:hypothetical protein
MHLWPQIPPMRQGEGDIEEMYGQAVNSTKDAIDMVREMPASRGHLDKRTRWPATGASGLGQQETLALQQTASLFDHLIGDGEQRRWDAQAE